MSTLQITVTMKLALISTVLFVNSALATFRLQEVFSWKALDYNYPTQEEKLRALVTGRFKPANNLPVGIEIWNEKLFVSVPRWREGKYMNINLFSYIKCILFVFVLA